MIETLTHEREPVGHEAWIFSGQGSQYPGVGQDIYESSEIARYVYDKASDLLGYNLLAASENEVLLKRTDVVQPLIFTYSYACMVEFENQFATSDPRFVAGHSLGEYNAIVAAGALTFEDALLLVKARGEAMQLACEKNPGGEVVLVNRGDKTLVFDEYKRALEDIGLFPVVYNSDNQIGFGGTIEQLEEVGDMFQGYEPFDSHNVIAIIPLKAAGAFHTPLMEPAVKLFKEALSKVSLSEALIPIVANTTATFIGTKEEISNELINHLTKPVLWGQSMKLMEQEGLNKIVEFGNKSPLSRMVKDRGELVSISNIATRFVSHASRKV
jgi:[acyl-carrier-protein] S-malonyltransferase